MIAPDVDVLPPGVIYPDQHDQAIEWMNAQHALVYDGSKTLVWTQQFNASLNRTEWRQSALGDFKAFYGAYIIDFGRESRAEPSSLGKFWLTHPRARRFRDVTFDPSRDVPHSLNLWQGFQVEPDPSHTCHYLEDHLFHVICGGNDERFSYLLKWMAYMFQRPTELVETAVVLRGDPGAGKGLVAKCIGRLLGDHFVHITHSGQLTNKFNGFLSNALFVFSDESVWAGDRAAEATLKALITEPTLQIQRKGREYVTMRNCVHLIMASNEDWVIPVRMKDRRFFVLDVMPKRSHDYYAKIFNEQKNGGAGALLHKLLTLDLSGYDPREIPHTAAKETQYLNSLSPHEHWWFDCLYAGNIEGDEKGWPKSIARDDLYAHYLKMVAERWRKGHPLSRAQFGRAMNRFLPLVKTVRIGLSDARHYALPTLSDARSTFEAISGQEITWPLDDEF